MAGEAKMQNYGLIRVKTGVATLQPIPIPKLRDDYILVRTVTVALNPTDWTTLDAPGDNGTLVGCDYAGVVEEVGPAVTKPFKKGDRIAGWAHGGNDSWPETGAFARMIAVKGDIQMHIPDGVSFETACTVGCGIGTVGCALYKSLGLPYPVVEEKSDAPHVFIYGGSTATGTLAIQFAKLSGWKVSTACSPKYFDWVKQLGADAVYDYHVPGVAKQIREATNGSITKVFDTVSIDSTAAFCADVFGPSGGQYCNLLDVNCPRSDVESIFFLAYALSGEFYIFEGKDYEALPDFFTFGVDFMNRAEKLWAEGKFLTHPQRVEKGGFQGALEGMQIMREGKYSGFKFVYRVDETIWE